MAHQSHLRLRPDQLHLDCVVRVKGEQACRRFNSKLMRNGITDFRRETASVGRPYHDYKIQVVSRVKYSRLMSIIDSTDDVELLH